MTDQFDVTQIEPFTAEYPAAVAAAFGRKAPWLHAIGNLTLLDRPGIGFCGSRKATEKGLAAAVDCAEQAVGAGFTVVSGYSGGVDFVAHRAALQAGGTTILVLPEGTNHFRIRRELRPLWDWSRVLVISQFEPCAIWKVFRAMARNELIIALSRAMIVIEAGATGGTLSAGLSTLSAGKPLFVAVYEQTGQTAPGNVELLERGGEPLSRSRSTGRANLERVRVAAATIASSRKPAQHPLL
jgi:DNA processing protein